MYAAFGAINSAAVPITAGDDDMKILVGNATKGVIHDSEHPVLVVPTHKRT